MKVTMKKNKKKAILLAAVAAISFMIAGTLTTKTAKIAYAEGTTFEMVEKASARMDNPSGIRFMVRMSDDTKNIMDAAQEKGFLIFPKAYLTGVEGNYHEELVDYRDIPVRSGSFYEEEDENGEKTGYYLYNGVMHTVKEENYDLDFASVAYYKEGHEYVYADVNTDFSRSIYYVLNQAYLDLEANDREKIDETFTWLGSETYPIQINTTQEMSAFATLVNEKNVDFEGKTVVLTNDITLENVYLSTGFEGTFDYNGQTITLVNYGNKKPVTCGVVKNESLVTDKQYALKMTEASASQVTADSQRGEYTAEGAKVAGQSGSTFVLALNYTKDELIDLKSVYNTVSLRFKVVPKAGNTIAGLTNNAGNTHVGIASKAGLSNISSKINTWIDCEISLTDFIDTMQMSEATGAEGANEALLMRVWAQASAGTTEFDLYVSDVVLSMKVPTLFDALTSSNDTIVGSLGETKVDNAGLKTAFGDSVGEYTGGAVSIHYGANIAKLTVITSLTKDEVETLKTEYSSVKFYFGIVYTGTVTSNATATDCLAVKAGITGVLTSGKWYACTMDIEDFITSMTNNQVPLVSTWQSGADYTMYFGDMVLSKEELPAPTLFDALSSSNDTIVGSLGETKVDNAGLKTAFGDSVGEYTGGAVSIHYGANTGKLTVITSLTKDEVETLKTEYSSVKFYFGIVYTGTVTSNANATDCLAVKAGITGVLTSGKWYACTMDIEDFIASMTNNQVPLVQTWQSGADYTMYFGDMVFVK